MNIVIKNGNVIDPYNNTNEIKDIYIKNGKICNNKDFDRTNIDRELDAEGCFVVPGLIDYHVHLAPLLEIGIPAEAVCLSSGVTTAVDPGSTGCANYESYRGIINSSKLRIKCYLNVCSAGLVTSSYLENVDPKYYNKDKIKYLFDKYKDELLGLKIRMDKNIAHSLEPLEETIKLAEQLGVRVVVHTTNSAMPQSDIAKVLRKGDVFTHMYHDFGNAIVDEDGKIYEEIKKARERGVIFDSANARFHFSFKIAQQAIKEGFLPDIISTDLTMKSLYKKPQIFNMLFLLSKYLNMGFDMLTLIKLSVQNPAKLLNLEKEIGSLSEDSCADMAILKIVDKKTKFEDWDNNYIIGDKLIKNMATIKDGDILYQDIEF